MTEHGHPVDLYLASASPRRKELLEQLGLRFHVLGDVTVDESPLAGETPPAYVRRLARAKARAGWARLLGGRLPPAPVLGADTCIALDATILGKPRDRADGVAMLRRLSGRSHEVLTAICLASGDDLKERLSRSSVTFAALDDRQIADYWDSGEPADKAGAYAIQGQGARFVRHLEGSYSAVVGLPLFELAELLAG